MRKERGFSTFIAIWMIISLFFLVIGLIAFGSSLHFSLNAKKIDALVTDIQNSVDSDGDKSKTVHIRYVVDGKEYNETINYILGMMVGKDTTVLYDPNDPDQVKTSAEPFQILIFPAMGALFFGAGIFLLKRFKNVENNIENLIKNGIKLDAYIENVSIDESFSYNKVNPYVINCKITDNSGAVRLISSGYIQKDPQAIIDSLKLTSLPVYVDSINPDNYYIDIAQILERIS